MDLDGAFSIATDELTPTLKPKRAFIIAKHAAAVDAMYDDARAALVSFTSMTTVPLSPLAS